MHEQEAKPILIPRLSGSSLLRDLGFSIAMGTLTAFLTGMILLIRISAMLGSLRPGPMLGLGASSAFILAASVVIVTVSCLILGVPTWLILRRLRIERRSAYVAAGTAFGAAIPMVAMWPPLRPETVMLYTIGAASGCACAWTWWNRMQRRPAADRPAATRPGDRLETLGGTRP